MTKPIEKFAIAKGSLKSGEIAIYVMGTRGSERDTMLQLMRLALNGHYFPLENMEEILASLPPEEQDTPQTKQIRESLKKFQDPQNTSAHLTDG